MKLNNANGFTIIELSIISAIISILATVAIPNFIRQQARHKQNEAFETIAAVRAAEEAYRAEHGSYVTPEELAAGGYVDEETAEDFDSEGANLRYAYAYAQSEDGSEYTVEAIPPDETPATAEQVRAQSRHKGLYFKFTSSSNKLKVNANSPIKKDSPTLEKYLKKCSSTRPPRAIRAKEVWQERFPFTCSQYQKKPNSIESRSWEVISRVGIALTKDVNPKVWLAPKSQLGVPPHYPAEGPFAIVPSMIREIILALDAADGSPNSSINLTAVLALAPEQNIEIARNIINVLGLTNGEEANVSIEWLGQILSMVESTLSIGAFDENSTYTFNLVDLYDENTELYQTLIGAVGLVGF